MDFMGVVVRICIRGWLGNSSLGGGPCYLVGAGVGVCFFVLIRLFRVMCYRRNWVLCQWLVIVGVVFL